LKDTIVSLFSVVLAKTPTRPFLTMHLAEFQQCGAQFDPVGGGSDVERLLLLLWFCHDAVNVGGGTSDGVRFPYRPSHGHESGHV
jgi:hypothetical protein